MGEIKKYDFLDLGGGLHDGLPASHIADNEAAVLENFYTFGTKLIRREGIELVTISAYADGIYGILAYKVTGGGWEPYIGGGSTIARFSAGIITALANLDGVAIAASTKLWSAFQYKGISYWLRENEPMRRATASGYQKAGIVAPAAGPTIADGGVGVLTAANYISVVTFYNSDTGAESNPSPASNTLALAATRQISWTNIPTSTNPQVNARRLYRTLPGQAGEYFFVGQINDNTTTTFADNVAVADMGDSVSFDNGTPPVNFTRGVVWNERNFATDDTDLYYSETFLPESFAEDSIISVFPDDGHKITALFPFGDRLIIGKTNKIHFLLGTDPSSFELRTLSDSHGCFAAESMRAAEGLVFWFGGDNFYRSDGVGVEALATTKIRKIIDRIQSFDSIYAEVWPERSLYLVSVPLDGAAANNLVLVYNYKTDAWSTFTKTDSTAPRIIAPFYSADGKRQLYATFSANNLTHYMSGNLDGADKIVATFRTKAWGLSWQAYLKGLRHVSLLCTSLPTEDILLSVFNSIGGDGSVEEEAVRNRRVSLDIRDQWKRYAFGTAQHPGEFVQLQLTYSGEPEFELEGLSLEVLELARRRRAV